MRPIKPSHAVCCGSRPEAKRDFSRTAEPAGRAAPARGAPRFVIQEHDATRLHWDLRLERSGVLVSWAVPKGLPEAPNENHFAAATEDHPLEYLDFDGEIPKALGQVAGGLLALDPDIRAVDIIAVK